MKSIYIYPLAIITILNASTPVLASTVYTDAQINFGSIKQLETNSSVNGASQSAENHSNGNPGYYSRSYSDQSGKIATSARIHYNYAYDSFTSNYPEDPHVNVATAKWSDNFTGTGFNQFLTFNVDKGLLAKSSLYGEESTLAGYGINITLNGSSIWSSHDEIGWASPSRLSSGLISEIRAKVNLYDDNKLTITNASVSNSSNAGLGYPALFSVPERHYDPFQEKLDLGVFTNGESFELSYEMIAYTYSGYFIGNDYVMAEFGDPLNVSGSGMQATVSSVPVPAAAYLFVTGLLGLVSVGNRRIENNKI